MNNINDLKSDYYNNLRVEEITNKYNISNTTYYNLIKKLGLKRDRTSKLKRCFNIVLNDNKPKEDIKEEEIKEEEEEIINLLDKRKIKQKLPKDLNEKLNVVKKNEEYDNTMKNALYILNKSKKTLKDKNINGLDN